MKTMLTVLTVIVLMSLATPLPAQTGVDYQLRMLMHIQLSNTNGQGVAGWLVMPNLFDSQPKFLAVGGFLIKERQNWYEFMGGALFNPATGVNQPVLDFRSYINGQKLDLYSELMWRPDKGIASSYVTFPVGRFRIGLETELTAGLKSGIKSDARLGPRLSFQIPWANRPMIATSVMPGIRGDTIIRTYLLFKF